MDDAELILRAYLRWGEDCAARLYGDFAFVISDPRTQSVYAARDGMGVRPLYFHHAPGKLFAFASNASAVAASPRVPQDLNEARIADFLLNDEDIDTVSTFYRAVRRLSPAHWCSMDARGYRESCYWHPGDGAPPVLPVGDDEWAEAVREVLESAVRHHVMGTLRTGGTIGSMVSGGLDSSLLAAMASAMLANAGGGALPAFSAINRADPACAETRAIRAMLASRGFASHLADLSHLDALLPDLADRMAASDEPFDHHMTIIHTQYLLAARAGVDSVLDGVDADSMFSDGGQMPRLLRAGRWITAIREARGKARFYGEGLPAWQQLATAAASGLVPEVLKRSVRGLRMHRNHDLHVRQSLIASDFARQTRRDIPSAAPAFPLPTLPSILLQERHRAIRSTSVTVALERYRRVAAVHGIEPRHPFLDRRVVELCMHLPDRQRSRDGWPKAALRHAAMNWLPDAIRWRRGKEHLGWKYSQNLFDRDRAGHLEILWSGRERLAPYVDLRRLERLLDDYRRTGGLQHVDAVLSAWALYDWLGRRLDILNTCRA
jgi:asparagine synthase (glutamine-hydrolysing)